MHSKGAGNARRGPIWVLRFEGEILAKFQIDIGTKDKHASFWGCVTDFGKGCPEVIKVFLGLT
eukprot:9782499-Ditylum_brightwellii.AAC.1